MSRKRTLTDEERRQHAAEYERKWLARPGNMEKHRANVKRYRESEKGRETARRYREENRERINRAHREWYEKHVKGNPEALQRQRESTMRSKARKKAERANADG